MKSEKRLENKAISELEELNRGICKMLGVTSKYGTLPFNDDEANKMFDKVYGDNFFDDEGELIMRRGAFKRGLLIGYYQNNK